MPLIIIIVAAIAVGQITRKPAPPPPKPIDSRVEINKALEKNGAKNEK